MSKQAIQQIPKLKNGVKKLINDQSVNLKIEQSVVIFRASKEMQTRIEDLLEKVNADSLTAAEEKELKTYQELDDYLSHVNRLIRNSSQNFEVDLAA